MKYTRITVDPNQMGGVACIRGLRIPVATVVGALAEGLTEVEVLGHYPGLVEEDIRQALQFAAEAVQKCKMPFTTGYGNYTEERDQIIGDLTVDDIVAEIEQRRQNARHKRPN